MRTSVAITWAALGAACLAAGPQEKPSPFGEPTRNAKKSAARRAEPVISGAADRTVVAPARPQPAQPTPPTPFSGESEQTGIATFYSASDHGRLTSNGETFDNDRLTAAHPAFPFGSKVRVTNIGSGKSVVVTVTDRGRFSGQRIISVSRRAAEELDFVGAGTARVKIALLKDAIASR